MITAGVVGGTGYTGVELLRLLVNHPEVEVAAITSRSEAGRSVAELFPNLRGHLDVQFTAPDNDVLAGCDVVFFATPHGVAMSHAAALLDRGVRVIDLGADFRIKDVAQWERWYGVSHTSTQWVAEAVYGLPEMNREQIRGAQLVACPGCYPTAVQLGFLPLLEAGVVEAGQLIADAKSGVSGAGRKANVGTLLCEAGETMKAYNVPGHRHLPEIKQGLDQVAGRDVGLVFVPHLTPMIRGMHATLYARLTREVDVQALFEARYREECFVDVLPEGAHPETRSVRGVNVCRLAVHRPQGGDTVVVLSVIDNLVKGASGQAVQNMNVMFGFEERLGLDHVALLP